MSGLNGGCGRGRTVRNDAGRGVPQPTPQYNPADQNYETNTFSGMFGGFLDPTQPFGNYFDSMNEQPHMQPPLVGAGMQPSIQPDISYMGGASSTPLLYQQFGTVSLHFNSNQFMGQLRCQVTQCTKKGSKMKG